jgi:DNA primase large subunit
MHLSRALAEATNRFDNIAADTRIGPLLKNLNKQYVGNDFSKASPIDKLTPDKVDAAAENNMPLCMKNLHKNLKTEHKLKHDGRQQYGLFLKGAVSRFLRYPNCITVWDHITFVQGMDLEDAMAFWEAQFTKLMSHDEFIKKYSYNWRHMYGKEGARKNYTPKTCLKIIMGTPPAAGQYHGCPYRHSSDSQLAAMLGNMKIGAQETKDIVITAKSGNYQVGDAPCIWLIAPLIIFGRCEYSGGLFEAFWGDAPRLCKHGWIQSGRK